jgi:transposase
VSDAVLAPVEEARRAVVAASVVHADETGWREAKQKAWLWVVATTSLAVFVIRRSRGADVARELLSGFRGILVSDRWGAYAWVDAAKRQLCWSHLVRDFLGFADHGDEAAELSRNLLRSQRRMFRLWHRIRDGTLTRMEFQRLMRPVERRIRALLDAGTRLPAKKIGRQCRRILKLEPALFTFVHQEGVLPTNNHAEQTIRHAVLWRKTSFGTDSENGSRFVERMLTVVMSLRLQHRNVLEWVTSAYQAKIDRLAPPALLPLETPAQSLAA